MKKIKAFSLLEAMIVLAIAGILMISVSQGSKLLRDAKIQKTVNQIILLKNVPLNSTPIDSTNEDIWDFLIKTKEVSINEQKATVGGMFIFENQLLILAANKDKKGILNLNTANKIKEKIDGTTKEHIGIIQVKLGSNHQTHPQNEDEAAYILEISMQ